MSKNNNKKTDVADDAARARKLLAKNEATKLNGAATGNFQLGQGATKNLGEHAVLVVVTNTVRHQLTISRPIGITDLVEDCWVANRTDDVPSMITRRDDPSQGAINQKRAALRSKLAVEAKLLVAYEEEGRHVFYYPLDSKTDRNTLLAKADTALKEKKATLKQLIEAEKEDPAKRANLNSQLAKMTDRTIFMDTDHAEAERELQKFYNDPDLEEFLEIEVPQEYRTRGGPFGDTPQYAITGSKGLSLDAVVNGLVRSIVHGQTGLKPVGTPPAEAPPEEEEELSTSVGKLSITTKGSSGNSILSTFQEKIRKIAARPPPKVKVLAAAVTVSTSTHLRQPPPVPAVAGTGSSTSSATTGGT